MNIFNRSKNNTALEPKTGLVGFEAKDFKMCPQGLGHARRHYLCQGPGQGFREGGQRGTMSLGPMEFTGPTRGPMTFRGPMGLRGAHHRAQWPHRADRNDTDKSACGKSKTFFFFFFGDHIKIRKKLGHFPILFWATQNQSCIIFELTPGPRFALRALGPGCITCGDLPSKQKRRGIPI